MRWVFTTLVVVFLAVSCPVALADDAVSVREASKAVAALEKKLAAAEVVLKNTKLYTSKYGGNVGRWVWLAGHTEWPRSSWGNLFYVINRESRGLPTAHNPSGASGLLQCMPGWYTGAWGYPSFDPFSPRANLKCGRWLYGKEGWSPWGF